MTLSRRARQDTSWLQKSKKNKIYNYYKNIYTIASASFGDYFSHNCSKPVLILSQLHILFFFFLILLF